MATRNTNITIDRAAYERLQSVRQPGESFSDVIRRVVRPPLDLDTWFAEIDTAPLSDKAARAVERAVDHRSSEARSTD